MLQEMLNVLFPKVCSACNGMLSKNETVLCVSCRHHLPLAAYHQTNNSTMKDFFYGRVPVVAATALLKFQKKGNTQALLHNLKYRGEEELSYFFGQWLGAELANTNAFKNIDIVIPVPLHKSKLSQRGFNQVAGFGKEIAAALNVPYKDDILIKTSRTDSQVFKGRFKRIQDDAVFRVANTTAIQNKHILLVDDIVTTGATLESCATQLLAANGSRISFATIAITIS